MALALALTGLSVAAQETMVSGGEATYLGRIIFGYDAEGQPIYAADNSSTLEGNALNGLGGVTSIDDVLRQAPGVTTRQDVGQPAAAVAIRGLQGQGRVEMTLEGVPQNFRLTGHAAEGYAYLDQAMLSSVSVTRGASVSKGGLSGTADFRMLGFDDLLDGADQGGLVRLTYGTNGESFSGVSAFAQDFGAARVLVGYAGKTGEEYENGDGKVIANTGNASQSLLLRGAYDLSAATELTATYYGYAPEFDAASYGQEVLANTFTLGLAHEASDLVDLRANVFVSDTSVEYVDALAGGDFVGREMSTTTRGFDVANTAQLTFGAWDLTTINGIAFSQDTLGGKEGGVNPVDGEVTRSALFTNNILTSGAFEFSFGLRAHAYEAEAEKRGATAALDDSSLDPKISLAYQVNDWLQPYVSAYRTMRAPSLQELAPGEYAGHAGFSLDYLANPDLRPETAEGYEIGANITRGDLSARIAYYSMSVEDYIYQNTRMLGRTGAEVQFLNLDGTTKASGIELEAAYETDALSAVFSYTKSDSDLPGSFAGKDLQAPESYALTLAGHFLDGALTLGATHTFTSGGHSLSSDRASANYRVTDLFASYALNDGISFNAKLTNLTDEVYSAWGSATVSEGTYPTVVSVPSAQGQNLFLGAEFRF